MGRKSNLQKATEKEMDRWDKNYAKDGSVRERFQKEIIPLITEIKANRQSKEEEWLEDYRLWSCQQSDLQMYTGRANLFLAELNAQVEASVKKYQTGIFPNTKYIETVALGNTLQEEANAIRDAVYFELNDKNSLPNVFERYQRQKTLFGTSAIKATFKREGNEIFFRNKQGKPYKTFSPKWNGVRVQVCDMFHTYIYPETAEDRIDLSLEFEEYFVDKTWFKENEMFHAGELQDVENFDAGMLSWVDVTRLQIENLAQMCARRKEQLLLTEGYCMFDLKGDGKKVPVQFFLANNYLVVSLRRNPYWHQVSPYLYGRYLKSPAFSFYGHSLAERLRSPQYMINDSINQTMDSMNYALSPVAVIDPAFAGDINSFKIFPGAKWFGSPQGIDFKVFPDVSGVGLQVTQEMRGIIQQFSDLNPSVAPQLSGKVRTATGAQALTGELAAQQREMIRDDESSVLEPLCRMTHILLQQYQTESYIIKVQGAKGEWFSKEINPEDIVGQVDFIWKGASYAEQTAVKTQQLLAFFDKAIQIESIKPGMFDVPGLTRKMAKEAFNMELSEVFLEDKEKFTVDPIMENKIILAEKEAKVHPGDNFEEHMTTHAEFFKDKEASDLAKAIMFKHMRDHEVQKQAQDQLLLQQQQMAAMQASQGMMQGEPPQGQGQVPGPMEGNPNQQTNGASSNGAIMQGISGV
jgi:hypothetical protein